MKLEYKILIIGLLAVGLVDSLGAVASRQLDFNYSILSIFSVIIYGTIGFLTTKYFNLVKGLMFAAILGLFDSTIGWKISMLLDANTANFTSELTIPLWIMTVVLMTGLAALVGLIGGGLARMTKSKSSNAHQ